MARSTIADLAKAAGVSVSTVNRILGGSVSVKADKMQRVQEAADAIGFYARGLIHERRKEAIPTYRLAFLLQQSHRELYQLIARRIREAAAQRREEVIEPVVEFVDKLEPEHIASRLSALGAQCDAVAVVAADHPLIGQEIQALKSKGKPVIAYITDQSSPERAGYVGTNNWKLGRTAAWLIAATVRGPGRVAVFIGNHRYQCQDISDASFRSYLRENAGHLVVEDSHPTHEDSQDAHRAVVRLLAQFDDLVGIYIVGGGISGVLQALREAPSRTGNTIRVVCRDIGPETRRGLAEGLITAALCHPWEQTSAQLVQTMLDAVRQSETGIVMQRTIPFEIITPESV